MKLAIFVLSDPKAGEEALGRVFNALACAVDAERSGDQAELVFAGTGTRWPAELSRLGHPAHGLYQEARALVRGASCACAAVFGATEQVEDLPALSDNPIPGTPGLASIRHYAALGYQVLLF